MTIRTKVFIITAILSLGIVTGCQSSEKVAQDPGASGSDSAKMSPDQQAALQQNLASKKGDRQK